MHQLISPPERRIDKRSDDDLKQHITQLGLDFSLVTRWTAFVAVSENVYNEHPSETLERAVPLPQVAGVSAKAYAGPTAAVSRIAT